MAPKKPVVHCSDEGKKNTCRNWSYYMGQSQICLEKYNIPVLKMAKSPADTTRLELP